MIVDGFRDCDQGSRDSGSLIDLRLVSFTPVSTPPKFGPLGHSVDDLRGEAGLIRRVIAHKTSRYSRRAPLAEVSALRLEAGGEIIQNPLSGRATRREVIRRIRRDPAIEYVANVHDPRGRRAGLLRTPDASRFGATGFYGPGGERDYDLTDSVGMTRELYFDPISFNILATRTILDSTNLDELSGWLADQGGSAELEREVFFPIRHRQNRKIRQTRIPCERLGTESDGVCIQLGDPGGRSIVTGG